MTTYQERYEQHCRDEEARFYRDLIEEQEFEHWALLEMEAAEREVSHGG